MGLLDDAIREHLDLKRRHGADPGEVERAEREALGPVRRAPARAPDDELPRDEGLADEDLTAPGDFDDEPFEAEPDGPPIPFDGHDDPDGPDGEDWSYDAEGGEPAAAVPAPHRAGSPAPGSHPADEPPAAHGTDPFAAEPPPAAPERHGYADHTVEYDVEEALGGEAGWHDEPEAGSPGQEGDDVLEETPEFLQDTPDHDRLWFEQRPPRDFDFDK